MKFTSWFLSVTMICGINLAHFATAQQTALPAESAGQPSPADEQANAEGWPREFEANGKQFTVYQPQVEKWAKNRIEQRAAVSVQSSASAEPTFGVIWMTARTEVDKASRKVSFEDVQITKANFPAAQAQQSELLAVLRNKIPEALSPISLDRLESSLAVNKSASTATPGVRNDPPKILYSSTPALLVYIDGEPVLRDSGAENLLRVINTHALVVFDQAHAMYYFFLGDRWFRSASLEGPWHPAQDVQPSVATALGKAKQVAVEQGQVDLLDNADTLAALKAGTPPKIIVSTVPAELVLTKGSPEYQPVPRTDLLYVKNTGSDLFMNTKDQNYYLLLSGRWYRAPRLASSWSYVPQHELPRDFAKIPESHPKGEVLASVANTPQAKEAVISNDIPQTATIDREQAGAQVSYDGQPQFAPVQGTALQYASNSATPVVMVNPSSYYCVQNGVWFVSPTPTGPWAVATAVPSEIYTIPPSSPIYYITYVHVYGFGPRYVYVGYLPGYLGSYVTPDGVVVFGTGWPYRHWIGHVWLGPPVTFGFGVTWGWGFGWTLHVGTGWFWGGTCFHPWWGPWRYGWYGHGFRYGHVTNVAINVNQTNIYRHWGRNVVTSGWARPRIGGPPRAFGGGPRTFSGPARTGGFRQGTRPNNLYSDRSGNLYRYDRGQGWQSYSGRSGWQATQRPGTTAMQRPGNTAIQRPGNATVQRPGAPAQPGSRFSGVNKVPGQFSRGPSPTARAPSQELNQERMARSRGAERQRNFPPSYRGGGFPGGGGFSGGGGGTPSGRGFSRGRSRGR